MGWILLFSIFLTDASPSCCLSKQSFSISLVSLPLLSLQSLGLSLLLPSYILPSPLRPLPALSHPCIYPLSIVLGVGVVHSAYRQLASVRATWPQPHWKKKATCVKAAVYRISVRLPKKFYIVKEPILQESNQYCPLYTKFVFCLGRSHGFQVQFPWKLGWGWIWQFWLTPYNERNCEIWIQNVRLV